MKKRSSANQSGSIIVSILIVSMFLTTLILALIVIANATLVRARARVMLLQAQYSAESGADVAIAQFNNGNESYTGSPSETTVLTAGSLYRSTFTSSVAAGSTSNEKIITSIGRVYSPASSNTVKYMRKIEVTAQRSSGSYASSMLSRNIIDIDSSVKNIWGIDIYVNGYINMNKNTTNLTAENISVAGKNTGASNCSIGGAGNLLKPSSFSHAGQTKTNITVAYNNCISPPGNTSNANFNVTANSSVSTISSTFIPWSQYMDNTYQSSPGGCSDWTSGSSPRNIPSTGNTKKTHYPDNGSNITTSCGTSGNINLGSSQYNIKDHVHLRANLCATSACSPTFYNPDSTIKFVFIEGTINFQQLITASGSGPIVLVTYGADPNSHGSACPSTDGDSIYLGQQGNNKTNAPAIYLLAKNGLCVDQTKFQNVAALGGMSGKNIYIATNSGNPFDLQLDPNFPVNQIPINLSWRAVRYRRI